MAAFGKGPDAAGSLSVRAPDVGAAGTPRTELPIGSVDAGTPGVVGRRRCRVVPGGWRQGSRAGASVLARDTGDVARHIWCPFGHWPGWATAVRLQEQRVPAPVAAAVGEWVAGSGAGLIAG